MNVLVFKLRTRDEVDGYDVKALRAAISRTIWEQGFTAETLTVDIEKEN
jgi:hypothetical protein